MEKEHVLILTALVFMAFASLGITIYILIEGGLFGRMVDAVLRLGGNPLN